MVVAHIMRRLFNLLFFGHVGAGVLLNMTCNLPIDTYLDGVSQSCEPLIKALEVCSASTTWVTRMEIAYRLSKCMEEVYDISYECSRLRFWELVGPNSSPRNGTVQVLDPPQHMDPQEGCLYPTFIPILNRACAYDFSLMSTNECCKERGTILDGTPEYIVKCQTHAAIQYVRCTTQEADNVAECVSLVAEKVDWLPTFQIYGGGKSCPNPRSTVEFAAGANLFSILLIILCHPALWKDIMSWRRFKKTRNTTLELAGMQTAGAVDTQRSEIRPVEGPIEPDSASRSTPTIPQRRLEIWYKPNIQCIELSALALFLEFGIEIGMIFAVSALLGRQYLTTDIISDIALLLVKPRPAPFLALLGLAHERWLDEGIDALVVDFTLSLAAAAVWTNERKVSFTNTTFRQTYNPAQPKGTYLLLVGVIVLSVPSIALSLLIFLISFTIGMFTCHLVTAVLFLIVAGFLATLPFLALFEAYKEKIKRQRCRWPAIRNHKWAKVAYTLATLSSCAITVGNWITFSQALFLADSMWCPGELAEVVSIWLLFPFASHVLMALYRIF